MRRRSTSCLRSLGPLAGLAVAASIVLSACVSTGAGPSHPGTSGEPTAGLPSQSPQPIPHPTGATDLVIRVETVGGFIAPSATLVAYPTISVYGDGTVVTPGPQIAIYPAPMLPSLVVRTISEAGIQQLLASAKAAGLLDLSGNFPATGVADAGTTRLTIATNVQHTVSAYALGEQQDDSNLDPSARAARAAIRGFVQELTNLESTVGATALGPEKPLEPSSIRVFVTSAPPTPDAGLPSPSPLDWPLATPLARFGSPIPGGIVGRCGVVSGKELATLVPLFRQANALTPWRSAGSVFGLVARPLLPDEHGCPAT